MHFLQIHSHIYLHTLTRTHVHACLHMLSHADTHSCSYTLMCRLTHVYACTHSNTRTHTFTCRLTCTITTTLSQTHLNLLGAWSEKAAAARSVGGATSQWEGDGTFRPLLSVPKSTCIYPKAGTEALDAQDAPEPITFSSYETEQSLDLRNKAISRSLQLKPSCKAMVHLWAKYNLNPHYIL